MSTPLPFSIPTYPHLARFSTPSPDFDEQRDNLNALALRSPESLTAEELCFIFNEWEPVGNFEEMAAYIPHALHLLQSPNPDEWTGEIVRMLIAWCYQEEEHLRQDAPFWQGLQDAFQQLFTLWSSTLAWRPREEAPGGYIVLYADHMENLLDYGWFAATQPGSIIDWLLPEPYLAQLYALDTIEHAVLALWVSAPQEGILPTPLRLSGERRRQAMEMVAAWLRTEASPDEVAIWTSVLLDHQRQDFLPHPQS